MLRVNFSFVIIYLSIVLIYSAINLILESSIWLEIIIKLMQTLYENQVNFQSFHH
jgi:hypothetical protein